MTKLFELPYSQVIDIYNQYLIVTAENDIAGRTRLLRDYPEIFQHSVREEIELVSGQGQQVSERFNKQPINLMPYLHRGG